MVPKREARNGLLKSQLAVDRNRAQIVGRSAFLADGWDPPIRISLLSLPPSVENSHMMMVAKRRIKKLFDVEIEEGSDDGRKSLSMSEFRGE